MKLVSIDSRNCTRMFCSSHEADSRWYTQGCYFSNVTIRRRFSVLLYGVAASALWFRPLNDRSWGPSTRAFSFHACGVDEITLDRERKNVCPSVLAQSAPPPTLRIEARNKYCQSARPPGRWERDFQSRPSKKFNTWIWLNRDFDGGFPYHVPIKILYFNNSTVVPTKTSAFRVRLYYYYYYVCVMLRMK